MDISAALTKAKEVKAQAVEEWIGILRRVQGCSLVVYVWGEEHQGEAEAEYDKGCKE